MAPCTGVFLPVDDTGSWPSSGRHPFLICVVRSRSRSRSGAREAAAARARVRLAVSARRVMSRRDRLAGQRSERLAPQPRKRVCLGSLNLSQKATHPPSNKARWQPQALSTPGLFLFFLWYRTKCLLVGGRRRRRRPPCRFTRLRGMGFRDPSEAVPADERSMACSAENYHP